MTTYIYTAIPSADVVAGYSYINNAGYVFSSYGSIVYDSANGSTQTINYPNSTSTYIANVGDSGAVIGSYTAGGNPIAFIDNAGSYAPLNIAPNQQTAPIGLKGYEYYVYVADINSSGEILGNFSDDGGTFGFIYSNGVTTLLPASIGYYPTYDPEFGTFDVTYYPVATALNDAGDVIGSYQIKLNDGTYQQQGFLLTAGVNPTFTPIVDSSGTAGSTSLLYLNNSDQIIGYYETAASNQVYFLYSGGTYTDIVGPAGALDVSVRGINDHGDVVGDYFDASNNAHGFIYDSATATYTTFNYNGATTGSTMLTGITGSGALLGYYTSSTSVTNFIATPAVAPTVTGITATTRNNSTDIGLGAVVTITVDMSETVTVTGKPTLQLSDNKTASYVSGSGTKVLTFSYTVAKGDTSSDLQVTGLNLPSGTAIKDQVGDTLTGAATKDLMLVVDTTAPVVSGITAQMISGPTANNGYAIGGDEIEIDLAFGGSPLVVTGAPVLKLGTLATNYVSTSKQLAAGILAFDYTVPTGQKATALKVSTLTVPKGTLVTDNAGNVVSTKLISSEETLGITADGVAPTVKSAAAKGSSKVIANGSTVTVTLTMSEAVKVTGAPSLTLNDGGTANFTGVSGTKLTFTYNVGPESTTDLRISGIAQPSGNSITDLAGNPLSSTYAADLKLKVNPASAAAKPASEAPSAAIALFGNYLASFAPAADRDSGNGVFAADDAANHHTLPALAPG